MNMNKWAILALGAFGSSCGGHSESEETASFTIDNLSHSEVIETVEGEPIRYPEEKSQQERVLARADTIMLKNGMRIINISAYGPQNECILISDRNRRNIAVCSHASEIESQTLLFSYGPEGRINKVKEIIGLDTYNLLKDPDSFIASLHGKEATYEYRFIYGDSDRLVEIHRIETGGIEAGYEIIKSSKGSHLEGGFRPVEDFWMSDLHGGRMELYCYDIPDISIRKSDTLLLWVDFRKIPELNTPLPISEVFFSEPKTIYF